MMWEVLFCLFVEKEEEKEEFYSVGRLQEWKQKGNTIGHTLPFGFCLVEFKKVVGLRTENGNPERRSRVFLMQSQRGREVGLGFFWCLGHCQCQRKWACGAGLRSVTIKGSGMPLCRNLRSCQPTSGEGCLKNLFAPGDSPTGAMWLGWEMLQASAGLNRKAWRVQKSRCRGDGDQ